MKNRVIWCALALSAISYAPHGLADRGEASFEYDPIPSSEDGYLFAAAIEALQANPNYFPADATLQALGFTGQTAPENPSVFSVKAAPRPVEPPQIGGKAVVFWTPESAYQPGVPSRAAMTAKQYYAALLQQRLKRWTLPRPHGFDLHVEAEERISEGLVRRCADFMERMPY